MSMPSTTTRSRLKDGCVYRFTDRPLAETYRYFREVDGTPGVAGALFSVEDPDPAFWPDYLVTHGGRITSYAVRPGNPDGPAEYLLARARPDKTIGRIADLAPV